MTLFNWSTVARLYGGYPFPQLLYKARHDSLVLGSFVPRGQGELETARALANLFIYLSHLY